MTQKSALFLAVALTVFVLVLIGGVIATVAPSAVAQPGEDAGTQRTLQSAPATQSVVADAASSPITSAQAVSIARDAVRGARLEQAPELVDFQGTVAYEVLLDRATVYVDATTGEVIATQSATTAAAVAAPQSDRARDDRVERKQRGYHGSDDHEDRDGDDWEDDDDD